MYSKKIPGKGDLALTTPVGDLIINMTRAEMAAKIVGKPGWGLTPNPIVIAPKHGHQSGQRLYS